MPELPEVEVVRRGLDRLVVGRRVTAVEAMHPRSTRRHAGGPADFADRLRGRRIEGTRRRGKFLWLPLDDDSALLAHLGMSGQLLVMPPGAPARAHLRVRIVLDADVELWLVDQRTFGGLSVSSGGAQLPKEIAHIARDPLDRQFDTEAFTAALRRRRTGLKRALLDQTLVSGIGNIYADEGLWRARLHYARPTDTLRRREAGALLDGVVAVMTAALQAGGTSFDRLYVDVDGESGYFTRLLSVYGRAGQPCRVCGTPIRRDPFMSRSSYTCPNCQPRPRRARW